MGRDFLVYPVIKENSGQLSIKAALLMLDISSTIYSLTFISNTLSCFQFDLRITRPHKNFFCQEVAIVNIKMIICGCQELLELLFFFEFSFPLFCLIMFKSRFGTGINSVGMAKLGQ